MARRRVFKAGFRQRDCQRCGRNHYAAGLTGCPVSPEVVAAVADFAKTAGRTWRAQLRLLWATNGDVDKPLLRQARNVIGPGAELDKVRV